MNIFIFATEVAVTADTSVKYIHRKGDLAHLATLINNHPHLLSEMSEVSCISLCVCRASKTGKGQAGIPRK
jgi:hypothetical protein